MSEVPLKIYCIVYKIECTKLHVGQSLLFSPYISLGTVWRLWISLGSHSALRCSHCESKWDWNWLKDSRFLFPISVLRVFVYCLVWQLLTLFIILYLFLVINEHSSVFPQLIKWADYGTPSSVTGGLVSSFLEVVLILPWLFSPRGIWQHLKTLVAQTVKNPCARRET